MILATLFMFCSSSQKDEMSKRQLGKANSDWTIFRGDPSLSGYVETPLPETLHRLWTFKTGSSIHSSPVVQDGRVFIGAANGTVYALDFETGNLLWSFQTSGEIEAPPLVVENKLVIGTVNGDLVALKTGSGDLLWIRNFKRKITNRNYYY